MYDHVKDKDELLKPLIVRITPLDNKSNRFLGRRLFIPTAGDAKPHLCRIRLVLASNALNESECGERIQVFMQGVIRVL